MRDTQIVSNFYREYKYDYHYTVLATYMYLIGGLWLRMEGIKYMSFMSTACPFEPGKFHFIEFQLVWYHAAYTMKIEEATMC